MHLLDSRDWLVGVWADSVVGCRDSLTDKQVKSLQAILPAAPAPPRVSMDAQEVFLTLTEADATAGSGARHAGRGEAYDEDDAPQGGRPGVQCAQQ